MLRVHVAVVERDVLQRRHVPLQAHLTNSHVTVNRRSDHFYQTLLTLGSLPAAASRGRRLLYVTAVITPRKGFSTRFVPEFQRPPTDTNDWSLNTVSWRLPEGDFISLGYLLGQLMESRLI